MVRVFEIGDPNEASRSLTYRLRSLAVCCETSKPYDESYEISRWAKFCADCFSYKPNPPPAEYFERHYYNDPWRDASLVKIIEYKTAKEEWEIAASIRVFKRTISTGDGAILAGGIGEVCTSDKHRRRSLSKMLLTDAIETMGRMGMQTSLLHASPALQAVYERGGNYEAVCSRWSVVRVLKDKLRKDAGDNGCQVRLASFPNDVASMAAIHRQYSESRFAGCIVRSNEYWSDYVSKEIGESLYVLTRDDSSVIGWLSVRERGGRYQLRDFGIDSEHSSAGCAMSILLKSAIACDEGEFDLHLPTAILEDIAVSGDDSSFVDIASATADDDIGWMYRPIKGEAESDSAKVGFHMVEQVGKDGGPDHLVWPTDSF